MKRWALVVACFLAAGGCAARTAKPDPALVALTQARDTEARADERLVAGCYRCLVDARDAYGRLRSGPLAESARLKHFEAALLVTLREKELALLFADSFAVAEAAAKELPASIQASRLLDFVHAIPVDTQGWGRTRWAEFRREVIGFVSRSTGELAWIQTAPLRPIIRSYLTLALGCSELTGPFRTMPATEQTADADPPPLLGFRGASCAGVRSVPRLQAILDADPAFVEASLFLGRAGLGPLRSGGDWADFQAHVARVTEAFPTSPAVTLLAARGHEYMGDCTAALQWFERTVTLEPRHDEALLGQTICLSTLSEHEQAIASATRLIALGPSGFLRDAHYWRAFNHRELKAITAARSDIEEARRLGFSVPILTLAGQIEYDQDSLDESKRDLTRARQLDSRACVAAWYLGLIGVKRQIWPEAADSFELAMYCYREGASDARIELRRLENTPDLDAAFLRTQRARLNEAIADAERQERFAAINSAKSYANSGQLGKIEPLVAVATLDPTLAEEIDVLRTYLKERAATDARKP